MGAPHYTPSGNPASGAAADSSLIRTEFTAIETGMEVLNSYPVTGWFDDANTAGQIYLPVPWACTIEDIRVVANAANSTTDTVFTAKINTIDVTGGSLTLASDAAIGAVASAQPTALNVVAEGGAVELETDGGGSGVMPVFVSMLVKRSA